MKIKLPEVRTSTLAEIQEAGCDCVMLKYDGFPVTINCAANQCNVFWEWGGGKQEQVESIQLVEPMDALLVGAKARLDRHIYLYDIWWLNGIDVRELSYRERHRLTLANSKKLDDRFVTVPVYPIKFAPDLWSEVTRNPLAFKGLVFRRSRDTAEGILYVRRYYPETPEAL